MRIGSNVTLHPGTRTENDEVFAAIKNFLEGC